MIGVFLGPLFSALLFSFVTFILIARVLLRHRRRNAFAGLLKTTTRTLVGAAAIAVLFALTWVFGAVSFTGGPDFFLWLFIIFNSLQGVFFCVFQKDARDSWILLFRYGKHRKRVNVLNGPEKQVLIHQDGIEIDGEDESLETNQAISLASVPDDESTVLVKESSGAERITMEDTPESICLPYTIL